MDQPCHLEKAQEEDLPQWPPRPQDHAVQTPKKFAVLLANISTQPSASAGAPPDLPATDIVATLTLMGTECSTLAIILAFRNHLHLRTTAPPCPMETRTMPLATGLGTRVRTTMTTMALKTLLTIVPQWSILDKRIETMTGWGMFATTARITGTLTKQMRTRPATGTTKATRRETSATWTTTRTTSSTSSTAVLKLQTQLRCSSTCRTTWTTTGSATSATIAPTLPTQGKKIQTTT